MNQRGLTRGDGLVFVCVALIFGMSFAPYYTYKGTDVDSDGDRVSQTLEFNAWTQGFWPLMAVVVLMPLFAFVLVVAHRYTQNADARPVGGLTLRQWATPLTFVAAWASVWSLGADPVETVVTAAGGNVSGDDRGHAFGAFVILPFSIALFLLMLVIDRVPGLAYPLFVTAPPYPPGYIPQQPGQPGYGTGMYVAQPGMPPPGTPVAHMPPPMTVPGGMPAAPAPAPVPAPAPTPTPAPVADAPAATPAAADDFAQFWLAVPEERPLLPLGGLDKTPVATLVPGNWYLAVEPAGEGFVVEVDGNRGVLWDTSGIQRGE